MFKSYKHSPAYLFSVDFTIVAFPFASSKLVNRLLATELGIRNKLISKGRVTRQPREHLQDFK